MSRTDLRPTLEQIAAGKDPRLAAVLGAPTISVASVKAAQPAFRAWQAFTANVLRNRGEPLAAPSEALTPLP